MVVAARTVGERTTREARSCLTSLGEDARQVGRAVREHWGIENGLPWVLAVAVREADGRVRQGHAAEHFAVLRHSALNLLRRERTA